jgi:hypothetical protein
MENNIYLYWVGKEYKLIQILRNLIYLHSTNGNGYKVNLITSTNINEYIKDLPEYFYKLCPAHQADYVRVCVICDYGGIWLDSDTLVLSSLDYLFDLVNNKNGFFIKENNKILCNGIFGSKANTPLMIEWKKLMKTKLDNNIKIVWCDIGNNMLKYIFDTNKQLYMNYEIYNGLDNMYPVNWDNCVDEYINKSYNNYKNIIREFQPLIVLVNSVYKNLENKTEKIILDSNMPLNYFINKSFENMTHLINYDFIEIGTSNFDTLIQNSTNDIDIGISIDAVKYYIDNLPNKPNIKKLNLGISNINSFIDVYYIPEEIIDKNNLQKWLKGCNCIGNLHPLHIKHNLQKYVVCEKVKVITCYELFYQNKVKKVKYLKIDTEGHDIIILDSLFNYLKYLPSIFYPDKILFETNEHVEKKNVDNIINLYNQIGYIVEKRGYDTIINLKN